MPASTPPRCAEVGLNTLQTSCGCCVACVVSVLDDVDLALVTFCDDVIGVAGGSSEGVSTSERVDDDVL